MSQPETNPKFPPKIKRSSSSTSAAPTIQSHSSIISLSRLRDYMPQTQVATRFFNVNPMSAANFYPHSSSVQTNNHYSVGSTSSSENLVRAKRVSPSLSFVDSARTKTLRNRAGQEFSSNQVHVAIGATQRESTEQLQDLLTDSFNCRAEADKSSKGAESIGQRPGVEQQITTENRDERKQRRIDSTDSGNPSGISKQSSKKEVEKDFKTSCSGNNMTPSSLLLIQQHHNYVEKHQGRDAVDCNVGNIQQQEANPINVRQQVVSLETESTKRLDDDQHKQQQHHNQNPTLHCGDSVASTSSSSSMSTNLRQFKVTENNGNLSATTNNIGNSSDSGSGSGINNSTNTINSSANVDSSNYQSSHESTQINHTLPADLLATNINSLQHNYQSSLVAREAKQANPGGVTQFVHYNAQNQRLNSPYYQPFQASMLNQQIKIEGRSILAEDSNNSAIRTPHNVQMMNSGAQSLVSAWGDLPLQQQQQLHQQGRSHVNQYHNDHYSMMPTVSSNSKSSSPNSVNSSPPPKMNNVHIDGNQHSSQVTNSVSSQPHLQGHLNQHYVVGGTGNPPVGVNHTSQQLHASHHYGAYAQPATGASNQHNLIISNHDQIYAHHQHQNQQQQLQQQQQHHHQQNQHHHQSQSISGQQSIYHQLANNAASANHNYIPPNNSSHYHNHIPSTAIGGHQTNHLMSEAHQSHLNSAAAACAAAAVVSQTLKTVANHNQQHHQYGGSIGGGFGTTNNLMNMTAQHHQQFHNVNPASDHHFGAQVSNGQMQHPHQQQQQPQQHHQPSSLTVSHTASMGTRKYQCKMCPQVFMSKAEIKYHNQNHMREAKPYKCLQCPKAFANSSYLSQHMRIHQGVKPYTCDICSRKFTQLSHLQQHKRTHTGDKPYKCNYLNCTKQFSQLSNLQSHSRCHQLDKPYKCNSCYKCFHDEQSLLEHIPRHLESKHLKKNLCIFCGSSYQQERGLVKHFQQYHTDKSPTLVAAAIAAGTTGNTSLIASLVSSTQTNVFAIPPSGGATNSSSSSSSTSSSCGSLGSSGSIVNVHNNIISAHGQVSSK